MLVELLGNMIVFSHAITSYAIYSQNWRELRLSFVVLPLTNKKKYLFINQNKLFINCPVAAKYLGQIGRDELSGLLGYTYT